MGLIPKNWTEFQHYHNRRPPWIKLHRSLLDDFQFSQLPVASRALAPLFWLLASEYEGGMITATSREIAFRLHLTECELTAALNPLIEQGFVVSASGLLAPCKQSAIPEKRREREKEEEKEGEKEQTERVKSKRISRVACELPSDWIADRELARELGWPEARIDREAQRFRDHAAAKGRTCKNWDAAWRSWITSPYQQPEKDNGKQRRRTTAEFFTEAIAEAESRERTVDLGSDEYVDNGVAGGKKTPR